MIVTEPSWATAPGFCSLHAATAATVAVIARKPRRDQFFGTPRA
jgi:hypothetical protein